MNVRCFALGIITLVAFAGLTSVVSAQVYQPPAGPTITPYLDYYNLPTSPLLSNYQNYVRPRAELRANLNQLGTAVNRQNERLDLLQNDFQQLTPSGAAPTGTGSTFLNYSHYYGGVRQESYTPQRRAYRGNVGIGVGRGLGAGRGVVAGVRTGGGGAYRQ
jgi:hypothetical protein